jgi:hypothetical protein
MDTMNKTISAMHEALKHADIEYTGYSCNGVNLIGDSLSIEKAMIAFHQAAQIDWYQRTLRHYREECGKLHARLSSLTQEAQ